MDAPHRRGQADCELSILFVGDHGEHRRCLLLALPESPAAVCASPFRSESHPEPASAADAGDEDKRPSRSGRDASEPSGDSREGALSGGRDSRAPSSGGSCVSY